MGTGFIDIKVNGSRSSIIAKMEKRIALLGTFILVAFLSSSAQRYLTPIFDGV